MLQKIKDNMINIDQYVKDHMNFQISLSKGKGLQQVIIS